MRDLLQAAVNKTQSGTNGLNWQAFDNDSFRARIGPGYLHVQRSVVTDAGTGELINRTRYSVQVTNGVGQVVAEEEAIDGSEDSALPLLQQLFTAARTAGLGGYEVIDHMLQILRV